MKENPAETKVSEGVGGSAPSTREIALQLMVKSIMRHGEPKDPMPEQADRPKEGCEPMEPCTGAGSRLDLWTHGERGALV